MTEINSLLTKKLLSYPLFVVGSTSLKSTELLPAIARLFVETITFGVLNVEDSYKTLQWLAKSSNANYSCDDLLKVAKKAKGYVFADLVLLMKQALRFRLQDKSVPPDNLELLLNHFDQAKGISFNLVLSLIRTEKAF